jgi:hypothetical protein
MVLLCLCLLAACALAPVTQAQIDAQRRSEFDQSLNSWHGASVQELLAKLGPPQSRQRQGAGRMVYVYAKSARLAGPTGPVAFACVVRYTVDEPARRVVDHQIEGC